MAEAKEMKSKVLKSKVKSVEKVATEKKLAVKKVEKKAVSKTPVEEKKSTRANPVAKTVSEQPVIDEPAAAKESLAKAGKRSAKALQEAEEKQAKENRKATQSSEALAKEEGGPKSAQKPPRSRLERRSKSYRKFAEQIDRTKTYEIKEAVALAAKTSPVKFDATVELHVRLGVDPKQSDQNIRDVIVLPAGTGKTIRVAVFADGADVAKAKQAGADIASADELLQQLDKGTINFDTLIATPAMMPKLGKYARQLGPKGLMPNPKSGTVASDVAKAVSEAKAGRVEYRVDSSGIIHVGMGKVSFGPDKLLQNAETILSSIRGNKPASVKGIFVQSVFITTSMGPSIRVQN